MTRYSEHYRRAISISERLSNAEAHLARSSFRVGRLMEFSQLGDPGEALLFLDRSHRLFRDLSGRDLPNTATEVATAFEALVHPFSR